MSARVLPLEGTGIDLGCGDGGVTALLARALGARWRLIGIDSDPIEVELARETGLYDALHVASAAALPLEDGAVDFVLSNSVLEHIEDLRPVFAEVRRVLRPGGSFILTVPSARFHDVLGRPRLASRLAVGARKDDDYRARLDRRVAHVHYLSRADVSELLEEQGLRLESASGYLDRRTARRWALLSDLTGGLLTRLTRVESPLAAQRSLGVRGRRIPAWVRVPGSLAARVAGLGLPTDPQVSLEDAACMLVVARRPT